MPKYLDGFYDTKADEQEFNELIALKDKIQFIAGMEQNDMKITAEDIEYCEGLINEVTLKLHIWFENKVVSLTYLGK